MGDNPMEFFKKPTPAEIEQREAKTAARNLQRYGRADYTNEKEQEAWQHLADAHELPIGPARTAAVGQWQDRMRDGHRLSNIEGARHQHQAERRADYWSARAKAKAAEMSPNVVQFRNRDQDQEPDQSM